MFKSSYPLTKKPKGKGVPKFKPPKKSATFSKLQGMAKA